MELYGYRLENTRRYFVPLNIHIPQFNISKPITFLVDTGCETTNINPFDSMYNLDIYSSIRNMEPTTRSITAACVTVDDVVLKDCALYYYGPNRLVQYEKLDRIYVSRMEINEANRKNIMSIPSPLGMDFLERYEIRFVGSRIILEK
ncbi:MAG TPA: hypothetical protein VFS97_02320 [Nitrososphaeraceae archaeon]|nr:hypothetical protein [Nitrososphaeraceae archaeon]